MEDSEKGLVGFRSTTCSVSDGSGAVGTYEFEFDRQYAPTTMVVTRQVPEPACEMDRSPVLGRHTAAERVQEWLACEGWTDAYETACWGPVEHRWPPKYAGGSLTVGALFVHCQVFNREDGIVAGPLFLVEFIPHEP